MTNRNPTFISRLGNALARMVLATVMVACLCVTPQVSAVPKVLSSALRPAPAAATTTHHNTHLHTAPQPASPKTTKSSKKVVDVRHNHWIHHWTVIHHARGTITGIVEARGGSVGAASVHLTGRRGHRLRVGNRHTVITSASGSFRMRGVKAGVYKVVASRSGVGKGSAGNVGVHSGGTTEVTVAIK